MASSEESFLTGEELSLEESKGENAFGDGGENRVGDGVNTESETSSSLHIFDAIETKSSLRSVKFNDVC